MLKERSVDNVLLLCLLLLPTMLQLRHTWLRAEEAAGVWVTILRGVFRRAGLWLERLGGLAQLVRDDQLKGVTWMCVTWMYRDMKDTFHNFLGLLQGTYPRVQGASGHLSGMASFHRIVIQTSNESGRIGAREHPCMHT